MNLATLLSREQIVPALRSTDHWEVIDELVDHLCTGGFIPADSRDETIAALREREDKISTGIGSGVAIPHAFSDDIERVAVVFGRSLEGVNFEAIDNNLVNFIVLFVVPKKEYHLHLKTLAAIAKLFTRKDVREQLAAAASADELLEVFASHAPNS